MKLVPWDHDLSSETFDGLFISNGPGDPTFAQTAIDNLAKVRPPICQSARRKTRDHSWALVKERCNLGIRKYVFSRRMEEICNCDN